jgi:hypothetical protein
MLKTLRTDEVLRESIGRIEVKPPWLWHLGLRKSFGVYAMCFERRMSL